MRLLWIVLPIVEALQFRQDGTFKIVQFSDPQIGTFWFDWCRDLTWEERQHPCSAKNTTTFMKRVLDYERPDLVVFVGDVILSGRAWIWTPITLEFVLKPVVDSGIPFAVVLGNHDTEGLFSNYWTRRRIMRTIEALPGSRSSVGFSPDTTSAGTYSLDITKKDNGIFKLWFFDSGSSSKDPSIPGYGWISEEQIQWFKDNSQNKEDSIAFFHIPTPEWKETQHSVGDRYENVASPQYNSGLLDVMDQRSNVRLISVGHDHVNDDCGVWKGIHLCYGGGMGYTTYGRKGWPRRARVFQLNETDSSIRTWKRLDTAEFPTIDTQLFPK